MDTIFPLQVMLNGETVELPIETETVTVTRQLETLTARTPYMTVQCQVDSDMCHVYLHSSMFAKTAGLMGSYNNEPADDFTTSSGTLAASLEEFTSSWLAARCRSTANQARSVSLLGGKEDTCHSVFTDRTSQLRPCFRIVRTHHIINQNTYNIFIGIYLIHASPFQVDAAPFRNMCMVDGNLCQAVAAYLYSCQQVGVVLTKPAQCGMLAIIVF